MKNYLSLTILVGFLAVYALNNAPPRQSVIKDRAGKVMGTTIIQQNGRTLTKGTDGRVIVKTAENKATGTRNYYDAKGVVIRSERSNYDCRPQLDTTSRRLR